MADLKNKYQAIINDLDKIISDKNELEIVKSKVNELTMMFMDVIDRLTFLTVERIDKLEQEQKNIEDRINKVQNSVTGIESDIYDEDDESEDESYEFEIVCPYCNYEFVADIDSSMKDEIKCPECNNIIELDWDNDDEECSYDCSNCKSATVNEEPENYNLKNNKKEEDNEEEDNIEDDDM